MIEKHDEVECLSNSPAYAKRKGVVLDVKEDELHTHMVTVRFDGDGEEVTSPAAHFHATGVKREATAATETPSHTD